MAQTVADDPSGLPAVAQGSARSYLLTILGELVMTDGDTVWTSQLLTVMTGLGIERQTARQAIARASASGWITGERVGREVRWTLTPSCVAMLREGERRVRALALPEPWDGRWLVAFLTIPQHRGVVRRKLYAALQRRGFGNPVAGVWLTTHLGSETDLAGQLAKYGLTDSAYVYIGAASGIGVDEQTVLQRAWPLDDIAELYRDLLRRFDSSRWTEGDPTMLQHVRLVNAWQHMPLLDPRPPVELLPEWIGRDATREFEELRQRTLTQTRREWKATARGDSV